MLKLTYWRGRARWIGALLIIGGLVVGGYAFARYTKIFAKHPITCWVNPNAEVGGTWTTGTPIPLIRAETTAAVIGTRIYLPGGMIKNWLTTDHLAIYDTATDTWSEGAPMPYGVHHAGVTALDGKVYVTGGYDDMGKMVRFQPDISKAWVYDPVADTWAEIAPMPSPRAAHYALPIDGKLFLVGGTGAGATEIWIYDPQTNSWDTSRKSQLLAESEHVPAVEMDGKIYLIGGRWKDVSVSATEVYDPATDTWTRLADLPVPRSALSLAVLNGKIHAVGGEDLDTLCTYGAHQVYDPATNTWTALRDIPTPRHAMLGAVVDGKWYLIGGSTGSNGDTEKGLTGIVEIFTPAS